jgi:hypothetical protein
VKSNSCAAKFVSSARGLSRRTVAVSSGFTTPVVIIASPKVCATE